MVFLSNKKKNTLDVFRSTPVDMRCETCEDNFEKNKL